MEDKINEDDLSLGFIRYIGVENDGINRYEFIFTDNIDDFWGENFEYMPCGLINEIMPNEEYITEVKTVRTHMKLNLIQDSACFSMQDCMDGIVALAWEDISEYEEYPSEGRICIFFGENINDVGRKLAIKQTILM